MEYKKLEDLKNDIDARYLTRYVAELIQSYMKYDVEVYDGVLEQMIDDEVEITEDSIIEYYEDAIYCSMDY
jgi:hypothetical protein